MVELIAGLLGLGVFLAVTATVGHVLWLMGAAAVRAVTGSSHPRIIGHCAYCAAKLQIDTGRCRACGRVVGDPPRLLLEADLAAIERQADRLRKTNELSADEQAAWLAVVVRQRTLLNTGKPAIPAAPAAFKPAQAPAASPVPVIGQPETPLARIIKSAVAATRPQATIGRTSESATTAAHSPSPAPAMAQPAVPKRGFADFLQAFMEEKNIRWGELISGMLIVISAVGLVISLWSTLQDAIPYFPALLFMLVTAAIHGAGLYTFHRWKLQSTSRGLLVIATLLIPLNFLAGIALSQARSAGDPWYIGAVAVGLIGFGALCTSAGRVLLQEKWWVLTIAVLGTSAAQLVISRWTEPGISLGAVNGLALMPLLPFLIAMGAQFYSAVRRDVLSTESLEKLFLFTGIAFFSVLLPLGLLVWETAAMRATLAALSPCLSVIAATLLAGGLVVQRRAADDVSAGMHTAATWSVLLGYGLLLAALVLAWPWPGLLIAVGLIDFVVLTALAGVTGTAVLHAGAGAALTAAALVGFHVWQGTISLVGARRGLMEVLLLGRSSVVLTAMAASMLLAAGGLRYRNSRSAAAAYRWSALGLGGFAAVIAVYSGFWAGSGTDLALTTAVMAIYAVALIFAASKFPHAAMTWGGSLLLLLALLHALSVNPVVIAFLKAGHALPVRPILAAVLLHAAAMAGCALCAWLVMPNEDHRRSKGLLKPLSHSSLFTSVIAIPGAVLIERSAFAEHAGYVLAIAVVWGTVAIVLRVAKLVTAAQWMATLGLSYGLTALAQRQSWWPVHYWDPRHIQIQLGGLAAWAIAWTIARWGMRHAGSRTRLVAEGKWTFDRILLGGIVVGAAAVIVCGVLPGLHAEIAVDGLQPATVAEVVFLVVTGLLTLGVISASMPQGPGIQSAAPFAITMGMTALTVFAAVFDFGAAWRVIGVDYGHIHGLGSWLVVGLTLTGSLLVTWERPSALAILGSCVSAALVPWLIAGRFEPELATVSALRWSLSLLALLSAVGLCFRNQLATALQWAGRMPKPREAGAGGTLRPLLLALTAVPVVTFTLAATFAVLLGSVPAGPAAESLFGRMGPVASHVIPLVILAAVMIMFAVRERQAVFALYGSFCMQLGVSAAYVLARPMASRFGLTELVECLQWNAVGFGLYSLAWLMFQRWIVPVSSSVERSRIEPLDIQVRLTQGLVLLMGAWAALGIVVSPGHLPPIVLTLGNHTSRLAAVLAGAVSLWHMKREWPAAAVQVAGVFGLALLALAAPITAEQNTPDNWLTFHTLSTSWLAVAAVMTAAAGIGRVSVLPVCTNWGVGIGGLVVILCVRALFGDPLLPMWPAGMAMAVAGLFAMLSLSNRSGQLAYVATTVAVLATTIYQVAAPDVVTRQWWIELIQAQIGMLGLAGGFWLAVEIYWQRVRNTAFDQQLPILPVHRSASLLGLAGSAVLAGFGLAWQLRFDPEQSAALFDVSTPGGWLTLMLLGGLATGLLWDRFTRHAAARLFVTGWIGIALTIHDRQLTAGFLIFEAGMAIACYLLLLGILWTARKPIASLAGDVGIETPLTTDERIAGWLVPAGLTMAAATLVIEFWVVLTFETRADRLLGAFAAALLAPALALLSSNRRRSAMQVVSLMTATAAAIAFSWAFMPVADQPFLWLQRTIRVMEVFAAVTFVYGVVCVRLLPAQSSWFTAIRRASTMTGVAALVSLIVVLSMEAYWFNLNPAAPTLSERGAITGPQIAIVAAVLVGLAAALISLAVLPGRDPLRLTERGRMAYVYAAELVLALLFLHIWLTMPQLFRGFLAPYWPFIVMAIAFAGVSVSELFRRLQLRVLAEPLERTGAFLPLLPALGFWVRFQDVVVRGEYWGLLFIAGLLYVCLCMLRKSFWYGLAAALAGNAGLWMLWSDHGFELLARPQMWLIPPALSVLIAAEMNRRRFREEQLTAVRYLAVTLIYVSSAGEMFLTGVGESLWLPMVLALVSVAGVMGGILLRVRAFLYLGSSFLLLSLVSMVWHAARNIGHVWPWWAFGIALGLTILTVFGLFEKKRDETRALLDQVRRWDA